MAKKSGSFKCPQCDRVFSMAPHLGRHMSTMHRSKAKPKGRPAGRGRLAAHPIGGALDGLGLLGTIQAARDDLASQQAQLGIQLAALDQVIVTLGGGTAQPAQQPAAKRRGRAAGRRSVGGEREGSLRYYIDQVLQASGGPMRVAEITGAVRKAGYRTSNKTLDKTVGTTLANMTSVKKIERGVYLAK